MPVNVGCIGAAGSYKDKTQAAALGYKLNYVVNPTIELSDSDWTSFAGTTVERSTDYSYTGLASLKVTNTSGGGVQTVTRIPFVGSDDVWHISAYVKLDPLAGNATYYLRYLQYATESSSAAIASGNIGIISLTSQDGWVRLSGSFTKNPSANFFIMRIATTSSSNTDVFYVDGAQVEFNTLGEYFDGSYGGFWLGDPHDSRSAIDPNLSRNFVIGDFSGTPAAVTPDSSGNIIIAVNDVDGLGQYANITKYDSNASLLWEKKISLGTDEVYIFDITTDSQDNIIAVGRFLTSTYIGFVIKFNKDGNVLWQRQHTGNYEELYTVVLGPSDSIYVGGSTYFSPPNYTSDIYVVKYDSSGTLQWKRQIQGTSFDEEWVSDGVVDADGNFYGTCYQLSDISGDEQLYTFKLGSTGTLEWQKYVGSGSYEQADSIVYAPNGDVYILGSGYTNSNVVRYDNAGNLVWQKEITNCYLTERAVDSNGDLYLGGDYLVKLDKDGTIIWQRSFGTTDNESVYGLRISREYLLLATDKFLYSVPKDGSGTGTYTPYFGGTLEYLESTALSISDTTYPATTPALTISESNIVDEAASAVVESGKVWGKKYTIE